MDFGLGLSSHPGVWDKVTLAEQHGFSYAGFVDSQMVAADPFVCMAMAARQTETIRLGPLIGVPGSRMSSVMAQAIATVNAIAPGRIILSLGTGFTARNTMGLGPLTVAQLERYARECRTLLRDEEVAEALDSDGRPLRFLAPPSGYRSINLEDRVPLFVAADGPKALRLAGEIGDGVVTLVQSLGGQAAGAADPESESEAFWDEVCRLLAERISCVREGAEKAGRQRPPRELMAVTNACVLQPGESPMSERVIDRVGAYCMVLFHAVAETPGLRERLPSSLQAMYSTYERSVLEPIQRSGKPLYQELHRGHLVEMIPGEEEVLCAPLVCGNALVGTAEELVRRIRALETLGVTMVTLWPPPAREEELIVEFGTEVIARLRDEGPVGGAIAGEVRVSSQPDRA